MPDALSALIRLFSIQWNGLPVASLVVFAVGGLMYAAMSRSTSRASSTTSAMTVRRPGWIARRRARGGIGHPRGRIGVGYRSAVGTVHLTERELAHHGALFGGPGSGKTTFLQLLVEASAGQQPVVIVDPKGSPALAETVRDHGGQVWTLDGKLPADLLDPRPWQVPDLLLEAEDYSADARAYRDAAHQRALWAAWALALRGEPMDLAQLRRLLDREELLRALAPHRDRDPRIADWLQRLEHQRGGIEDSGARGLDRSLGTLLDGVAMRGSLHNCAEALRLEDVLDTRGLVLFSLDVADYPHATRKVASWILLGMGRLARQLGDDTLSSSAGQQRSVSDAWFRQRPAHQRIHADVRFSRGAEQHVKRTGVIDRERAGQGRSITPRALLLVDEVGALGHSARHLRGLVGRARESGLAVVLATQGPSDLEAVDRALLPQVLQDTAWQLAFRQGSPQDAERMQALFGLAWVEDRTRYSDGRDSWRRMERPRVSVDEWMNALEPGDAWLRVAPIDRGWRQERVRVALPSRLEPSVRDSDTASVTKGSEFKRPVYPKVDLDNVVVGSAGLQPLPPTDRPSGGGERPGLPPVPPDCPPELLKKVGADILAKCERRWPRHRHELGPCLVWREGEPTSKDGRYGRMYDATIGRTDYTHLVVWRRVYPDKPIPKGWTADHLCRVTLCQRPDHLERVTRAENTRRRHQSGGTASKTTASPLAAQRFAVALFAAIGQPTVRSKAISVDELVDLLSRFEVLEDKRRGRCWSPTRYADGATSRGNAGVLEVSALVFDLDRVPPDPARLAGVYWLGHTTWSHTPTAPRWRVVIPLTTPVPSARWRDVWQRARAALCPEADPACKDPSRAYWLPSHSGGVTAKTTCHDAPLLDPSTLPPLPPEPPRAELRTSPSAKTLRRTTDNDRRRGEAYMDSVVDKLSSMPPNSGRNDALNRAAWTLGRWVAAGALEQGDVEDELYAAAETNHLVADDGDRQCWATIRSGLSAGLQQPIDLDADRRAR